MVLATLPMLVIAHHAAVLAHEFGHSFTAWLLGLKEDPLTLRWGAATVLNALTLHQIGENVDYGRAWQSGRGGAAALVAAAGPLLVNGGLYAASRAALLWHGGRSWPAVLLLFWFLFMNLANVYDYVPIRTFAASGDIAHLCRGLGLSPWWIYAPLCPAVVVAIADLYRTQVPRLFGRLALGGPARALTHILATTLMFGVYGLPGLRAGDPASILLSGTSLLAFPIVLVLCWPERAWLRARASAAGDPGGKGAGALNGAGAS
ncbi:hypothetical protein ACW9J6_09020 [Methylobacterium sp. JK268]